LVDQTKNRVDLLKNAAEKERRVTELEQELKQVREAATAEKKLEDELAEKKHKANEVTTQFNALTIGKVEVLCW
jgi:regulator of sigma D